MAVSRARADTLEGWTGQVGGGARGRAPGNYARDGLRFTEMHISNSTARRSMPLSRLVCRHLRTKSRTSGPVPTAMRHLALLAWDPAVSPANGL